MTASLPRFARLAGPILRTPAQGADTIVWLTAAAPASVAAGCSGAFWSDRRPRSTSYLPGQEDPPGRAGPALGDRDRRGRRRPALRNALSSPVPRRFPVAESVAVVLVGTLIVLAFGAESWGWFGGDVYQWLPPLSAHRETEWHGWLALPVALAVATVAYGPRLAETLPWGRLVGLTWVVGVGWGLGLALGRGYQEGIVAPLASEDEYLVDVPRVDGFGDLLRTYTDYILLAVDDQWTTHNSGHPPLPLIVLHRARPGRARRFGGQRPGDRPDRVDRRGGRAGRAACRRRRGAGPGGRAVPGAEPARDLGVDLGGRHVRRGRGVRASRCSPSSAVAPSGARSAALAVAAGLVLGTGIFLSYGLLLMGPIALGVLVAARTVATAAAGRARRAGGGRGVRRAGLLVVRGPAAAGAALLRGQGLRPALRLLGVGQPRRRGRSPSDLPCGRRPARRSRGCGGEGRRAVTAGRSGAGWLATGAAVAIVAADVSGLSKSEVERIWLPFLFWLVPAHRVAAARPAAVVAGAAGGVGDRAVRAVPHHVVRDDRAVTAPRPVFVLHEHHKPQHHFDLRLEENGVLRSWALPRGLPTSPRQNRLAVAVPDHDLDHAGYEDADKSIADDGWWEEIDRNERRIVLVLHGREDARRYALIQTDSDWLMHLTKEQP